jgi:hypothetical protein
MVIDLIFGSSVKYCCLGELLIDFEGVFEPFGSGWLALGLAIVAGEC